jgi:hypothetical protein
MEYDRKLLLNIIRSIVFILFLNTLSCKTQKEIEVTQGWNSEGNSSVESSSMVGKEKYAILFDVPEGVRRDYLAKHAEYKLPVLKFFIDYPLGLLGLGSPPRIYTAIWKDGTIVWGVSESNGFIADDIENDELEIKYFQSKIDSSKIEALLTILENSSVWESEIPIVLGGKHSCLVIRCGEKKHGIRANCLIVFKVIDHGREYEKGIREWERVAKEIFAMIPSEGRPVDMSLKQYGFDSPYDGSSWLGIVE